jgi:hypothetical protein
MPRIAIWGAGGIGGFFGGRIAAAEVVVTDDVAGPECRLAESRPERPSTATNCRSLTSHVACTVSFVSLHTPVWHALLPAPTVAGRLRQAVVRVNSNRMLRGTAMGTGQSSETLITSPPPAQTAQVLT